jgi:hemerythrin-like domain-containing protein
MEDVTYLMVVEHRLILRMVALVENARGYAALLREHIHTEDNILYPLPEKTLPADVRPAMIEAYNQAEAAVPADFSDSYTAMVEGYESGNQC